MQLEVFFDKPSIHVGADLTKVIQKHLGEAHLLAAAWSERYPTRAACMWEYRKAFFAVADYSRFVGRGEELWRIYDALLARLLGDEHPSTLTSRNNLAQMLETQGDLRGARGHKEAVYEARARLLGTRHEGTTLSAWNLFTTLAKLEDATAQEVLQGGLLWLLSADPAALTHAQRQIRDTLAKRVNRT